MEDPTQFRTQLADLTVKLTSMVAERIAFWSKDIDPSDRNRILQMIEGNLPDVIANTIAKTPSLHSSEGVVYMEQNLNDWADSWARRFITK